MKRMLTLAILAAGLSVASCVTPSQVSYLRDVEYGVSYDAQPVPELKLQPGDRISVQVFSEDPTLAVPFNAGIITQEGGVVSTPLNGYTIDKDGYIEFPVLGSLHIEGKTLKEVKEMIARQIQELGYIKNPVLNINMENFTIFKGGCFSVATLDFLDVCSIKLNRGKINVFFKNIRNIFLQ